MGRGHPLSEELLGQVVDNAAKDGYAARDFLANTSTDLARAHRGDLFGVCVDAGLGPKTLPANLLSQLEQALQELSQQRAFS